MTSCEYSFYTCLGCQKWMFDSSFMELILNFFVYVLCLGKTQCFGENEWKIEENDMKNTWIGRWGPKWHNLEDELFRFQLMVLELKVENEDYNDAEH